jgi:glucosamine-6-phosphate deaminase
MRAPSPLVLGDPDRVGLLAAELIANRLSARPSPRLLLPTGHTPLPMYAALRSLSRTGALASSGATVLQLDEYAGIAPADPRSFAAQLRASLDAVPLRALCTIDGTAADLTAEARRHETQVEAEPIDLAVLGLGRDGHVAFDEPPASVASGVRLVQLTSTTREDAAAAFGSLDEVPDHALTVGLGTLYRARELLLLVTGAEKATALRAMLEEPVHPGCPASLLRDHPRLTIICDRAAAGRLTPRTECDSDRALVVLGHRDRGVAPEHRISSESRTRLRTALRMARAVPVRAVILTGFTSAGGLSEAEQMKTAWDESEAPALLEVAGRNTAENASRSLPLLLAMADVRRVTVVSSAWHLRAPWFFAPYRHFGLEVGYRASLLRKGWPRLLLREFTEAPRAPLERRRAMAGAHAVSTRSTAVPPVRG